MPSDYPTIEQIESDGKLVSARTAKKIFGLAPDMLTVWREQGCPRIRGRCKIKAQQRTVFLLGRGGGAHVLWFYERELLATIAKSFEGRRRKGRAPHGRYPQHWTAAKIREKWSEAERFTDQQGREWVSHQLARAQLKVSATALWYWRRRGCPHLGGRRLLTRPRRTPFGRRALYYLQEQLDEIVRVWGQPSAAKDDAELVPLEEAASLTGLHRQTLYLLRRRGELITERRLRQGKDGKIYQQVFLHRGELVELKSKRAAATGVPADRMTIRETVKYLRVSKSRILAWVRDCPYLNRPLDAIEGKAPAHRGAPRRLLVLRADVQAIRAVFPASMPPTHRDVKGVWLPLKRAAETFGVTPSAIQNHRLHGRVEAKQIKVRGRGGRRGRHWVYLQTSLAALFGPLTAPVADKLTTAKSPTDAGANSIVMPSACREGGSDEPIRDSELQDINPYPTRVSEFAPRALDQLESVFAGIGEKLSKADTNGRNRLHIDLDSCTAMIDGQLFKEIDSDALRALSALRQAQLADDTPISKRKLRQNYLPGCHHDTTLSRWFAALPMELYTLIDSKPGAGLRLILSPH